MKIGDLVRLKIDPHEFYDWGEIPPRKLFGYYLRDPKTKSFFTGVSGLKCGINNVDVCFILKVMKNHVLLLTPRTEIGLIHMHKIEVVV